MKKLIRNFTKLHSLENLLIKCATGKGDESLFVKILPRHFQYTSNDIRLIERNGIRYEIHLNDYNDWLLFFGINNQHKENIYAKIKDGDLVLDVGVNIGEVLLNIAKVNPNGEIHGFEPAKSTFEKLNKNISLNPYSNINIHQIALSDKIETVYYEVKEGHSGGTMMSKEKKDKLNHFLEALTLDEFVSRNSIKKIDFIKVDIEGFEMNFLKGAEKTLQSFRPSIFMEVDQSKLTRQNSSAKELLGKLQSFGYNLYHAETNQEIVLDSDIPAHFDVFCTPK